MLRTTVRSLQEPGADLQASRSREGGGRPIRSYRIVPEPIHWDQASVLVQSGLLDPATLPVAGVETARKVMDAYRAPSNTLMKRTIQDDGCRRVKVLPVVQRPGLGGTDPGRRSGRAVAGRDPSISGYSLGVES